MIHDAKNQRNYAQNPVMGTIQVTYQNVTNTAKSIGPEQNQNVDQECHDFSIQFSSQEGCRSGLTGSPGKTVYQQWYRGFKSHPFRQLIIA